MNAAELFVKALQNEGVQYIFGVPGEENIAFLEQLRQSEIEFVPTRHEQGGAFMADLWGRLSGRAGVCLSTIGPGATNLMTPVADAQLDHAPLVAITAQADTTRMHKESHQYIDIVSMLRPITKWNASIRRGAIVPEVVRKAFKLAEEEKPGSTHIEFPEDVAEEEVGEPKLHELVKVRRPAPDYKAVKAAVELIKAAKRPIIMAGNGAIRKRAAQQLGILCEKTNITTCYTFMGKGAVDPDYPGNLYTVGLQSKDWVSCALDKADLVIAIGYDLVEYAPQFWNAGNNKQVLHIDFTTAEVDEYYHPELEVIGDIASSLWEINQKLDGFSKLSFELFKPFREAILKDIHEYDDDDAYPLKPQKILHDLRAVMADDDILISDVGAHKMWVARSYIARSPNSVIISNGFASMGIALPGAIGAKLLYPQRKVVALCGDGGFMMSMAELETACRLGTNIVVLIWTDSTYGLIKWKQDNKYGHSFGIDFNNPDFVKLAESFGAKGVKVGKGDDLQQILRKALTHDCPVVIDCPVDYRENIKLTDRLGQL
jgi:acetolactate synthase-1/2/3 large subunit